MSGPSIFKGVASVLTMQSLQFGCYGGGQVVPCQIQALLRPAGFGAWRKNVYPDGAVHMHSYHGGLGLMAEAGVDPAALRSQPGWLSGNRLQVDLARAASQVLAKQRHEHLSHCLASRCAVYPLFMREVDDGAPGVLQVLECGGPMVAHMPHIQCRAQHLRQASVGAAGQPLHWLAAGMLSPFITSVSGPSQAPEPTSAL
jgi:hypothetical protein